MLEYTNIFYKPGLIPHGTKDGSTELLYGDFSLMPSQLSLVTLELVKLTLM